MSGGIADAVQRKPCRPGSDYYIYMPSAQAKGLFLYPMIVGRFQYLPGYCLRRKALDGFLVMRLVRGVCEVESGGRHFRAREGQVVVLDCCAPTPIGPRRAGRQSGFTSTAPTRAAITTPSQRMICGGRSREGIRAYGKNTARNKAAEASRMI